MNKWCVLGISFVWFLTSVSMEKESSFEKLKRTLSGKKNPCTGKYELRKSIHNDGELDLIAAYQEGNRSEVEKILKSKSYEEIIKDISKNKQPIKEKNIKTVNYEEEILEAAKNGDTRGVRTLLEINPSLCSAVDTKSVNRTPLHWAARHGHINVVKILAGKVASVNQENKRGLRPLEENLHDGYASEQVINCLIEKGAYLHDGKTLARVIDAHNVTIAKLILDKKVVVAHELVIRAFKKMFREHVIADLEKPEEKDCYEHDQQLLQLFCNKPEFKSFLISGMPLAAKLYFAALRAPTTDLLKILLGEQFDDRHALNGIMREKTHDTLLHSAVRRNDQDKINFLLEHGILLDSVNKAGFTPLLEATSKGFADVAFYLILKGANVRATDAKGEGLWSLARFYKQDHQKIPDANAVTKMELIAAFFTFTQGATTPRTNGHKNKGIEHAVWDLKLGLAPDFYQLLYKDFGAHDLLLEKYPKEVKELEAAYDKACENCVATQDKFKEKGGRVVLRCCGILLCKECYDLRDSKRCPKCQQQFARTTPYHNGAPLF